MNKRALNSVALAKGKDIHNRKAKLALYKECLALATFLDDDVIREHTLAEVREKWQEARGAGGYSLQLQIASCLDRISYGRLCLSKVRQRMLPKASLTYDWGVVGPTEKVEFVSRRDERQSPDAFDHSRGNRDFVPMTNWGFGNMDPDAIVKHKELTDRQYFIGPHWRNRPKPMQLDELSYEEQLHVHFQGKPKMRTTPKKHF